MALLGMASSGARNQLTTWYERAPAEGLSDVSSTKARVAWLNNHRREGATGQGRGRELAGEGGPQGGDASSEIPVPLSEHVSPNVAAFLLRGVDHIQRDALLKAWSALCSS
jgi:hypothetical protein